MLKFGNNLLLDRPSDKSSWRSWWTQRAWRSRWRTWRQRRRRRARRRRPPWGWGTAGPGAAPPGRRDQAWLVDTTNLGWGVFRAEGITNITLITLVCGSPTLVAQPHPVGVLRNSTEQNRWPCAWSIFRCQQTSKFVMLTIGTWRLSSLSLFCRNLMNSPVMMRAIAAPP